MTDVTSAIPAEAKQNPHKMVWAGGLVEVNVPESLGAGEIAGTSFLHFSRTVGGKNSVNFFIHLKEDMPDPTGKTIVAEATVREKDLGDGRRYLFVDLVPVPEGKPTVQIVVTSKVPAAKPEATILVLPAPLVGAIVISPPSPFAGNDAQLQRLMEAGWKPDGKGEEDREVPLMKVENGVTRRMIHYRPKKK